MIVRKSRYIFLILVIALIHYNCSVLFAEKTYQKDFNKAITFIEGGTIHLDNIKGAVHVSTWDKPEVDIKALIKVKGDHAKDVIDEVIINISENPKTLEIDVEFPEIIKDSSFWDLIFGSQKPDINVSFELTVPKVSNLELNTNHGIIAISDINGFINAKTTHAKILLYNISGNINAKTSHAAVESKEITGNVTINTSHSKIILDNIAGDVNARTSHASVNAENIKGDVIINTTHSGVSVYNITGNADVVTSHAGIKAENITGSINAAASHSKILLKKIGLDAYAKTSHSSIVSENIKGNIEAIATHSKIILSNIEGNASAKTSHNIIESENIGGNMHAAATHTRVSLINIAGNIDVKTTHNNITLKLLNNVNADITAKTTHGKIYSDFPVQVRGEIGKDAIKGKINKGGTLINLKTTHSDIKILELKNESSEEEKEKNLGNFEDKDFSCEMFNNLFKDMPEFTKESHGKYSNIVKKTTNHFWYNRIEGPYIGIERNIYGGFYKNSALSARAGYGFEDYNWKWRLAFIKHFDQKDRFFTQVKVYDELGFEEDTKEISDNKNTLTSMLLKTDYRDYYGKKGYSIGVGYHLFDEFGTTVKFVSHNETGILNNTGFSIFNRGNIFRINPDIIEGTYNGIEFALNYRKYRFNADFKVSYTDEDFMKSDFSYSQFKLKCKYNSRPTYNGKFYFTMNSGFSAGSVAPQRWFDFGGKVIGNYTGELRGVRYKEFTGDRMLNGILEYHLKGKALEHFGLDFPLSSSVKFILWSGVGWSSISDKSLDLAKNLIVPTKTTNGIYNEFGIGITHPENVFRWDFIHTSEDNKILAGLNVFR